MCASLARFATISSTFTATRKAPPRSRSNWRADSSFRPQRTYSRKIREAVISIILEHRFTKQQIFAMYANEINLGQRGSFSIDGFGEAAQAYFGKDVSQLSLSECALLAGMIQSPSRLNPFRHPERAIDRRNLVLDSMVEIGAITKEQAEAAKAEPLHLVAASVDESEAPYFVDLVHDQLTQRLGDRDFNREGLRIYTSLDPDLQRVATQAVDATMPQVDKEVDRLHARDRKLGKPYIYPQVALIALDPHTGQVLALVGGRNYGKARSITRLRIGPPDRSSSLSSMPPPSRPRSKAPCCPARQRCFRP